MIRFGIILIISLAPFLINAQKLTLGLGVFSSIGLDNIETRNELLYHFSDDANSQYTLKSSETLLKSGIAPKFYLQYMFNDNLYFNYESGFMYYNKAFDVGIKNDVLDTREVANYNYSFLSNAVYLGYKFGRKRVVRPKLFGGLSALSMVSLNESSKGQGNYTLANDGIPGDIIHQQISSINNNFLNASIGFGIEYYFLNIDLIYDRSVLNIESERFQPFYEKYHGIYISVGIDLVNIIPNSSKKVTKYPSYLN